MIPKMDCYISGILQDFVWHIGITDRPATEYWTTNAEPYSCLGKYLQTELRLHTGLEEMKEVI